MGHDGDPKSAGAINLNDATLKCEPPDQSPSLWLISRKTVVGTMGWRGNTLQLDKSDGQTENGTSSQRVRKEALCTFNKWITILDDFTIFQHPRAQNLGKHTSSQIGKFASF